MSGARVIRLYPPDERAPCDVEPLGAVRPSVYVHSAAQRNGWWSRLSPGQKVDLVLGAAITGILIAALMMVPA